MVNIGGTKFQFHKGTIKTQLSQMTAEYTEISIP